MSEEKREQGARVLTDAEIKEGLNALLLRTLSQLSEHFDSVQILCTKLMPNGSTHPFVKGEGDWFARWGVANAFVKNGEARELSNEIARVMPPPEPPDGSEDWKEA